MVRDLKVIEGASGLFVAMPSRKLAARCPNCGYKNHLRARFCNDCGNKLTDTRAFKTSDRNKLHADVAHPINTECRKFIQTRVIEEYQAECERAQQPDYVAKTLDEEDYADDGSPYDELVQELKAGQGETRTPDRQAEAPAVEPAFSEPDEEEDEEEDEDEEEHPEPDLTPTEEAPDEQAGDNAFGAGLV